MGNKVLRLEPLPTASDPALLLRVVQVVSSGVRELDALSEAVELSVPGVQGYLDAAVWLGLIAPGADLRLTPRGLTLTSADPRRRRRLLAQAIWHTPDAATILRGAGPVLAVARVAAWLREKQPNLPDHKLERLSAASANLLSVALEFPGERRTHTDQLRLPFELHRPAPVEEARALDETPIPAETRDDRVTLARVHEALQDEGELSPGRAALIADGPAGPLIEQLIRKGLAERDGELLIATPALAGGAEEPGRPATLPVTTKPFLECLETPGLGVAFPSSLAALSGGLGAVNAGLQAARQATGPGIARATEPRRRVHGGLLHPGERSPRIIPDALTLRLRALQNTPAFALLAAALLLERRSESRLSLRADGSALRWRRKLVGALGETLAAFGRAQGWAVLTPERPLLTDESWVAAAIGLGLASRAESRLVMDEALFVRLRDDVEASLVLDALDPLAARLERWLEETRKGR